MKYIASTNRIFLTAVIIIVLIASACRKEAASLNKQNLVTNNLAFLFLAENKIRINQAITVYDSTLIRDSIDFVSPPSDKYYKWEVIPDNGCDSVQGDKNKGITSFVFHCSGTYLLTAKIYDSLTQNVIATTDTLEINVTSDTLHPTQPIKEDDILNIRMGIVKSYSNTSFPPNEVWISLVLSSTKFYNNYTPYINFNYTSNINVNDYSYVFRDVKLNSYPFAFGAYGTTDIVWGELDLHGLSYGVPANLSITWLGITYSGTVTLLNENQHTFSWNNSGAVKMH